MTKQEMIKDLLKRVKTCGAYKRVQSIRQFVVSVEFFFCNHDTLSRKQIQALRNIIANRTKESHNAWDGGDEQEHYSFDEQLFIDGIPNQ